ncbi:MAG: hypothetical protein V4594_09980 [Bacteroidota bacterium]
MELSNRFQDEEKSIDDFGDEVWVVCPTCKEKSIIAKSADKKTVRWVCTACGFSRQEEAWKTLPANHYFDEAKLWLVIPFRDGHIKALNGAHLDYLERYIAAGLREHYDRKGFTLVEKLPKYMQSGKNRQALLKTIKKLRLKK